VHDFLVEEETVDKWHYTESNDKPSAQQSNKFYSGPNDWFELREIENIFVPFQ